MNLKILLTLISTIYLSGCQTLEHRTFQYKADLKVDANGVINLETSRCHVRPYEYRIDRIGATGNFQPTELRNCFDMVGTSPLQYIEDNTFFESVRLELKNHLGD
jgi:hypothetical protein